LTAFQTPPNDEKIERVYAFLSVDAKGFNGIVAGLLPGIGATPLVTASRKLAQSLIPIAQEVADRTGLKVALYAFKREGDEDWISE
jgi:hypothetical protein